MVPPPGAATLNCFFVCFFALDGGDGYLVYYYCYYYELLNTEDPLGF